MSGHGLKITNFHYSNMAMPAPNPSAYPKWVYPSPMAKEGRLARDEEEEARIIVAFAEKLALPPAVDPVKPAAPPGVTLQPDNDEKAVLLALAKEKNIKVDARWRIEKIRAAMTAAQPKADG